jgi:hypothetical protein
MPSGLPRRASGSGLEIVSADGKLRRCESVH